MHIASQPVHSRHLQRVQRVERTKVLRLSIIWTYESVLFLFQLSTRSAWRSMLYVWCQAIFSCRLNTSSREGVRCRLTASSFAGAVPPTRLKWSCHRTKIIFLGDLSSTKDWTVVLRPFWCFTRMTYKLDRLNSIGLYSILCFCFIFVRYTESCWVIFHVTHISTRSFHNPSVFCSNRRARCCVPVIQRYGARPNRVSNNCCNPTHLDTCVSAGWDGLMHSKRILVGTVL